MKASKLIESLYDQNYKSVWAKDIPAHPKLEECMVNDWRTMRAQAPTEETLDAILLRTIKADVRWNLWNNATVGLDRKAEVMPDNQPLRFWWPFRFIEPFTRQQKNGAFTTEVSWWWKHAPFEVRQVKQETPAMTYDFFVETEFYKEPDLMTGSWSTNGRWIGQILRLITHNSKARFVIRFRS